VQTLRKEIERAFKSKGVENMSKKDLVYTLSFDLNIYTPEEAKRVVDEAEKEGIIEEVNGLVRLSGNVFDRIVKAISEKTGKDTKEVFSLINKKHNELKTLAVEVVALITAKEIGLDVSDFIEDVENLVLKS
jgi:hypothetical protein